MTPGVDAARELRRAELRQIYATWLAPEIQAIRSARSESFRKTFWGCLPGVLVAAGTVAVLKVGHWPPEWWSDPLSLGRIALALVAVVWMTRTFLLAKPDAVDAEMFQQDLRLDVVVARMFSQLRPGAVFERCEEFPDSWMEASRLASGNVHYAPQLVRWRSDDLDVCAGEVDVRQNDEAKDDAEIRFRGWVGVATRPHGSDGRLRIRPIASRFVAPPPDARCPALSAQAPGVPQARGAGLLDAYEVCASDPALAAQWLVGGLAERLRAEAAAGRHVHLAVTPHQLTAAIEHDGAWFYRLHPRLDEAHVAQMGETLDTLDALLRQAVAATAAPPP